MHAPRHIRKYPRTQHIEGSRLQPGDEDLSAVRFSELAGQYLVVEEKLDGANAAVSFSADGSLWLQSRGHYLTGGPREKHFALLKTWASRHARALFAVLGSRYVMYGEWLYAKHTVFYDRLPHYFMEFDVLDTETDVFLSTAARHRLLAAAPVRSVPVLDEGVFRSLDDLTGHVGPSLYKSEDWRGMLQQQAESAGVDGPTALAQTDGADASEGLYVKVEADGRVLGRYKWVRASFLTAVVDSGSHWLSRPIVPNVLAPGVDLFAESSRDG